MYGKFVVEEEMMGWQSGNAVIKFRARLGGLVDS
jgi:hypothetical protein